MCCKLVGDVLLVLQLSDGGEAAGKHYNEAIRLLNSTPAVADIHELCAQVCRTQCASDTAQATLHKRLFNRRVAVPTLIRTRPASAQHSARSQLLFFVVPCAAYSHSCVLSLVLRVSLCTVTCRHVLQYKVVNCRYTLQPNVTSAVLTAAP
jgi:hypothetical protein